MDKLSQWIAITVVAVLVIVAGAWFMLIAPKRSEAADIKLQRDAQVSANQALQGQITMLKSEAKSLPQKQAKLAAIAAKIPDNPAEPALIRALTAAADDAGVELISMSPTQPTPMTGGAGTTTAAAASASGGSAGSLSSITVSLNVVGGYFQIEQFLDRIESLSRAMNVSALTIAPGVNPVKAVPAGAITPAVDPVSNTLAASITATVYMATGRTTAAVPGK